MPTLIRPSSPGAPRNRPFQTETAALGYAAGTANLYRYVHSHPVNAVDPAGLFTYAPQMNTVQFLSGKIVVGKGSQIGYSLRLDIGFEGNRPAKGAWVQVNTVVTTVVTIDKDGKLDVTRTEKYIKDVEPFKGQKGIQDRLGGPDFNASLRKEAVLVISRVTKEAGFTRENLAQARGTTVTKEQADALRDKMANDCDKGTYSYFYYWSDMTEAKKRMPQLNTLVTDIKAKLSEAEGKALDGLLQSLQKRDKKFSVTGFDGQLLLGDSGLDVQADLDGKKTK